MRLRSLQPGSSSFLTRENNPLTVVIVKSSDFLRQSLDLPVSIRRKGCYEQEVVLCMLFDERNG